MNDLNAQTTKERQGKIIGVGRSVVSVLQQFTTRRRRLSSSLPFAVVFRRSSSFSSFSSFSPPALRKKIGERKKREPLSPISLIRNYHFSIFRRCNFSFGGAPFSRDPAERFDLALPKTKTKQNKNNTFYFILNAKVAIELSTHLLHCNSPVPSRHIQIITALSSYFLASEKKCYFLTS